MDHLHFNGMTDYGSEILLGQATDILHLEIFTKRYLQELAALTRLLYDKAQPIYLGKYTKEVNQMREGNSSGPSYVTPSMVKTEVLDPELAEIGWQIFNFPWCTGYLPKCYQRGLGLLIKRDPTECSLFFSLTFNQTCTTNT